jgi:CHAD domain-containing protein
MAKQGSCRINKAEERSRLKRARALLEMFEEDCGRRAANVEELREWMGLQYTDKLQVRMNKRLHGIDAGAA